MGVQCELEGAGHAALGWSGVDHHSREKCECLPQISTQLLWWGYTECWAEDDKQHSDVGVPIRKCVKTEWKVMDMAFSMDVLNLNA